jgi:hypothetical protein
VSLRGGVQRRRSNLCAEIASRPLVARNDTLKKLLFLVSSLWFLVNGPVFAGETIVAHETDRYFYKDGKILRYEGQFEYTYFLDLEREELTRTRIFDYLNKKITPDETVYHIEKQLLSHPTHAERYILPPVIRAVGQTNADSIELLVIDDGFVNSTISTSNEIVISRAKRLK